MSHADDEFFVGYLPTPPGLRRRSAISGAVFGLGLMIVGALLASTTQGAGAAHFAFANNQGTLGLFSARPAASLWTLDPSAEGGVRGTLLVRQGKFGLGPAAAALDGHIVRVSGSSIERDGHRMLELASAPTLADAELPDSARAQLLARVHRELGEVTVTGEIVDSKCYLGRMRPGDRRTHRACAQLCIAGGIPPVLVAQDESGADVQYWLATRDGSPIFREILPFVAEPVAVTGKLVREGDVLILQTDVEHVTRL